MTAEEFENLPDQEQAANVYAALEQLVNLSSHYAFLLNAYDGGERMQFANAEAWILRLYDTRTLPVVL